MTPAQFERAVAAFHEAIALDNDGRRRFLDGLAPDAQVQVLARRMLDGHRVPEWFLSEPAIFALSRWMDQEEHGRHFGTWRVIEEIGRGGMATVYLAERADGQFRMRAALKILRYGIYGEDVLRRFERERQILADLDHPNIVRLLDGGVAEDGRPYLVMDYVDGLPLTEYLSTHPLTLAARLQLFDKICEAVAFAHAHHIVHRDLKPSNIRVTTDGTPKLLDFGIAKLLDPEGAASEHTRTASRFLTLDYASPEQAQGLPTGPATDIYSLGLILYELVAGRRLRSFKGMTPFEAAQVICTKAPDLRAAAPFEQVVARALSVVPNQRFPTVADLRQTVAHGAPAVSFHRRRAVRLVAGTAAVTATLALGAYALSHRVGGNGPAPTLVAITSEPGVESDPNLSPDGTKLVYSKAYQLMIRDLTTGATTAMPQSSESVKPQWLADGKSISYIETPAEGLNDIGIVANAGGQVRRLAQSKHWGYCLAPDGKSLAVIDRDNLDEPWATYLVDAASGIRRKLTSPPAQQPGDEFCTFSPDGTRIAVVRNRTGEESDLHIVPIAGGAERQITFEHAFMRGAVWTPDGRELIYSAKRRSYQFEMWRIAGQGGSIRKVELAPEGAVEPAITRRGDRPWRLAFKVETRDVNNWKIGPRGSGATVLAPSRAADVCVAPSPDARRLAFSSSRSGWDEIWVSDANGGSPLRLTHFNGPKVDFPRWSPDGKWLAFTANDGDNRRVFVVPSEGGPTRRLTSDEGPVEEGRASWSRDGQWIYYRSNRSGQPQIWKARARDGSDPLQVTTGGGYEALEAPGGRTLYYAKAKDEPGVWEKELPAGGEHILLPSARQSFWAICDRGIYFLHRPNRWTGSDVNWFRFDTRQVVPWGKLPHESIWGGLSASRNGSALYWSQMDTDEGDIFMIDNFR
jgi:Tol biopolymer transport system component